MPASHLAAYFRERLNEQQVTLAQASKLLPSRSGKHPSLSCLYRWASRGCRGVVLETWSVGVTRVTSREAIARFLAELNQDRHPRPNSAQEVEHARALRRKMSELASRRLDELGFGAGEDRR